MSRFLSPKLLLFLVILTFLWGLSACKSKPKIDLSDKSDEVVYISDELLGEDTGSLAQTTELLDEEEEKPLPVNVNNSIQVINNLKDYQRLNDSPEEFAKVAAWHAVGMVYPETFSNPKVQVLKATESGDLLDIALKISWSDQWVRTPYVIKGNLKVNKDGSNASFRITEKNLEAEALEVTYQNTKNFSNLPNI